MVSLLHLPQNIWRDNVLAFFSKTEDLVRLDSSVMRKCDRTVFLSNISGYKWPFAYNKERPGQISWFCTRNIIVECAFFNGELQREDAVYLPQLLAQTKAAYFLNNALSQASGIQMQPEWFTSAALTEIYMHSCGVVNLSSLSVCKNLVDLNLNGCHNASQESIIEGLKGCTRLKSCSLVDCTNFRAEVVVVLLQCCLHLTNLVLRGIFDLNVVFSETTSKTSISSFSCDDGQSLLSGLTFQRMSTVMPQIASINLKYINNTITNSDIEMLTQSCKELNAIGLTSYNLTTNTALLSIAKHVPALKAMYIDDCWHINDGGIVPFAHKTTNLRTLRLSDLGISGAAVQAVGTHCRLLANLTVKNCNLITDSAFTTLNVAELKSLDVSGTAVTGTFASHVFSSTSALSDLTCQDCRQLTTAFVQALTPYARLGALTLGNLRLTESDWLQLTTAFPNLRILHINDAPIVNDTIALSFKSHSQQLVYVSITRCNVSEDVLKLLPVCRK